jgi:O-succinylbenzoate synthase
VQPPELPALSELLGTATPFALPLRRRFRGLQVREGMLIQGPSGWGEFAPFDDYSTAASGRWLAAAIEAAYGTWSPMVRDSIPVNAILPSLPLTEVEAWTNQAKNDFGVRTVKVKVAESTLADDVERLGTVRSVLGAEARIRIDCNGKWSLEHATASLPRLVAAAGGLEYVEQPLADLTEMALLRSRVDVRFAVDEGLRAAVDLADPALPDRIRAAGDVLVLKAGPLGGVAAALQLAERIGLPVVVSGALDSSVGLAAGLALAAAVPELTFDCGLGTGALFAADLSAAPLVPSHGQIRVGRREPDPAALSVAAERVSSGRREWWLQRLTAAYGTLTA